MFELRCHAQKVSVIATKSTSSSSSKKRKHLLSRRFWSRLVVVRLGDTTTTLERPREKRFDVQSFDHKTTRDREIRKKIGFSKRRSCKSNNAQYLPGDRVVEILRLPGKGEFDYDAKKRRQREERCCCCGSKRGSVFGRHVSFCEEAFLCVWQLETLSCIFTLTFLLLVVLIKTNLFCVFRAMPSSLSSSANRVLVVVSLNDDLRSRVYRHRRHTTL